MKFFGYTHLANGYRSKKHSSNGPFFWRHPSLDPWEEIGAPLGCLWSNFRPWRPAWHHIAGRLAADFQLSNPQKSAQTQLDSNGVQPRCRQFDSPFASRPRNCRGPRSAKSAMPPAWRARQSSGQRIIRQRTLGMGWKMGGYHGEFNCNYL